MKAEIDTDSLPDCYAEWRNKIQNLIEKAKLNAAIHVNTDMLFCLVVWMYFVFL